MLQSSDVSLTVLFSESGCLPPLLSRLALFLRVCARIGLSEAEGAAYIVYAVGLFPGEEFDIALEFGTVVIDESFCDCARYAPHVSV